MNLPEWMQDGFRDAFQHVAHASPSETARLVIPRAVIDMMPDGLDWQAEFDGMAHQFGFARCVIQIVEPSTEPDPPIGA